MKRSEIIEILVSSERDEGIFQLADKVRKENVGDEIHLRALIEFSNICRCQCKYCGLQSTNREIQRYRLSQEEILNQVKLAANLGYKTIVLQSGEDEYFSSDKMCEIIREIKKFDVALTLSIGEKTSEEYRAYKKAGADRYLLRIETTDKELYKKMHPNADFENRLRCLYDLKKLGYEVGTGCLVGLPEQTVESLAEDILFFKELKADMIGIGPFIPHEQTPLKAALSGDFNLALKVMALTRINLPDINIPATTAMETLRKDGQIIALQSGANVVMPNLTPRSQAEKYEIYPEKYCAEGDFAVVRQELIEKFQKIGRSVSSSYGNR